MSPEQVMWREKARDFNGLPIYPGKMPHYYAEDFENDPAHTGGADES